MTRTCPLSLSPVTCKLDANQTTVDLEKLKTENTFIKSQMDDMMDVIKGALTFRIKDEPKE